MFVTDLHTTHHYESFHKLFTILASVLCCIYNRSYCKNYCTRAKMNNLINVVKNLLQCCAAPCQRLLSTTIVHSCSRSTTIADNDQQACFGSCSNYCSLSRSTEQSIEQYSSTLSIQQVLLNLDTNIVQTLFSEQRCIKLINFCACTPTISSP